MFKNERGQSKPVSYVFILLAVMAFAGGAYTVVDTVDSSLTSPTPATTDWSIEETGTGNYSLYYTGEMNLTEDNTNAIKITNDEQSMVVTPSDWKDRLGTSVGSGEMVVQNITGKGFSFGDSIDIVHYESAAIKESGEIADGESGERLKTLLFRTSSPPSLDAIGNGSDGDDDTDVYDPDEGKTGDGDDDNDDETIIGEDPNTTEDSEDASNSSIDYTF